MRQYDPQQVTAVWTAGVYSLDILEGAVAATFAEYTRDNPRWTRETDREGNAVRVKNNNRGGTFRVTLTAKSPLNKTLSAIAIADDVTENVVGPILVKDLNGGTIMTMFGAFLEDQPDVAYGSDGGTRVWVWQVERADRVLDGQDVV